MKLITLPVYSARELKDINKESYEKAYFDWVYTTPYVWEYDNDKTLNEFCKIFGIEILGCNYFADDVVYIDYHINLDEAVKNLSGIRLSKYIWNNYKDFLFKPKTYYLYRNGKYLKRKSRVFLEADCPLTGYYIDHEILDPIYDFLARPYDITFEELIDKCLNSWLYACERDYQSFYSNEGFEDFSDNNEIYYFEDGTSLSGSLRNKAKV